MLLRVVGDGINSRPFILIAMSVALIVVVNQNPQPFCVAQAFRRS